MDFRNWKTTLFGLIAALPQIVHILFPSAAPEIMNLITAISGFIALYFAKDKNITGVT